MNNYFDTQDEMAGEAERVVGKSYAAFLREAAGNHAIAALRFGRAYWKAKGITKYDRHYEERLAKLEKRTPEPPPAGTATTKSPVLAPAKTTAPPEIKEPDLTEENLPF